MQVSETIIRSRRYFKEVMSGGGQANGNIIQYHIQPSEFQEKLEEVADTQGIAQKPEVQGFLSNVDSDNKG